MKNPEKLLAILLLVFLTAGVAKYTNLFSFLALLHPLPYSSSNICGGTTLYTIDTVKLAGQIKDCPQLPVATCSDRIVAYQNGTLCNTLGSCVSGNYPCGSGNLECSNKNWINTDPASREWCAFPKDCAVTSGIKKVVVVWTAGDESDHQKSLRQYTDLCVNGCNQVSLANWDEPAYPATKLIKGTSTFFGLRDTLTYDSYSCTADKSCAVKSCSAWERLNIAKCKCEINTALTTPTVIIGFLLALPVLYLVVKRAKTRR